MGGMLRKLFAAYPGGGRRILLCGSSEDVIGHFLKSRDTHVAEVVKPLIDEGGVACVIPDIEITAEVFPASGPGWL
jgi:hypothetical protein